MANAAFKFPHNPPATKEAYFIRKIFESRFPSKSASETVSRWIPMFVIIKPEQLCNLICAFIGGKTTVIHPDGHQTSMKRQKQVKNRQFSTNNRK